MKNLKKFKLRVWLSKKKLLILRVGDQKQSLDYLVSQNIVSIKSIDTRALTRHIRDQGAMNGIISSTGEEIKALEEKLKKHPKMIGLDLAKK